jgi:chaperonin GroEL
MVERKFRVEDALNATKAAIQEGIVPGGGYALSMCKQVLDNMLENNVDCKLLDSDVAAGWKAVSCTCEAPFRKIVENAGFSPDVVKNEISHLNKKEIGFNASNGSYVDLIDAGVIDPVKVTRTALKNAVSVALTFLNLNAVVYEEITENA